MQNKETGVSGFGLFFLVSQCSCNNSKSRHMCNPSVKNHIFIVSVCFQLNTFPTADLDFNSTVLPSIFIMFQISHLTFPFLSSKEQYSPGEPDVKIAIIVIYFFFVKLYIRILRQDNKNFTQFVAQYIQNMCFYNH